MRMLGSVTVRWLALLALCAAYLQGGLNKAFDFTAAIAEMQHFGVAPAAPLAGLTIVVEIGASLLILTCGFVLVAWHDLKHRAAARA